MPSVDFLVIGAGVAGLRAAIELAGAGRVLVAAKDSLHESSSEYAQGGIAVALSDEDEVGLHEQDTLAAGDGLCNRSAVRVLVEAGPREIEKLIEWGTEFDREGTQLAFTREGAHSRNRVLHAHGDSTGREIARALYRKASSLDNVEFRTFLATTDLVVEDGQVAGVIFQPSAGAAPEIMRARAVLLATGGLGRVYLETTNPDVATGDGVALAYRAGAEVGDIEFVQFHPTALHVEGAPRFLLSEALRGEGAYLVNAQGERFTDELAPRDVVSRAILAEIRRSGAPHVFLDLRHRGAEFIRQRFPRIHQTCLRYGVDIAAQPAPVHPAAHYAMGGVQTDLDGRTTLPRLYAAGEVACTGVHGANRLASNSLLEALVYGARAGAAMREWLAVAPPQGGTPPAIEIPCVTELSLRRLARESLGIVRDREPLERAIRTLGAIPLRGAASAALSEYELRSLHAVATLIARCALAREESRGGHFRQDFPSADPAFRKHSLVSRGNPIIFR
ncbi:MAG: L-aspartate oxidase [Bryobacterales bacterium]|nr:L-aspartate oxidase [Bryobacterales bacterium]